MATKKVKDAEKKVEKNKKLSPSAKKALAAAAPLEPDVSDAGAGVGADAAGADAGADTGETGADETTESGETPEIVVAGELDSISEGDLEPLDEAPASDPTPAPSAMPGGFAKLKRLKDAARAEAKRLRERAAGARKQRGRSLNHFEKIAQKQGQTQQVIAQAAAFVAENTPKANPGRRLSRLDHAKNHSRAAREQNRRINAKLQRMRVIARLSAPPIEESEPEIETDTTSE